MKKMRLMLISILALIGLSGCGQAHQASVDENDLKVTSVSLDITYQKMEVDTTITITPTITYLDNQEVPVYKEWRSSNSKVASVDENGLVTALKIGRASITFIAGYKSASCAIEVPDPDSNYIEPGNRGIDDSEEQPGVFTIKLNTSEIILKTGDSYQLTATTSEEAAVTWTSSNENVATIHEKGIVLGRSIGETTITAKTKSRNDNLEASFNVRIDKNVLDAWTVMIYMCGSDLESRSGLATSDIQEMLKTTNQPNDVNVIIETGGSSSWSSKLGIDGNALTRYHIEDKTLIMDAKLPRANMGKQSTFESFLNWGLDNYPADNTGVILWNHGGALGGCCYDDYNGTDSLVNSEASRAFKNVFDAHGIDKLEFVGYDACLMQIQDVAEFNSHYFKYMVGSEESETGYGWVYNEWLDDLYSRRNTSVILKANCDSFIDKYGSNQTLSYLDLSKMSNFHAKLEDLSVAIKSTVKNNYNAFKSLMRNAKTFDGFSSYGVMDGLDFLNKLRDDDTYSAFKDKIDETKNAYTRLVSYSRRGSRAGESNGLAFIAGAFVSYPSSETSFSNWRSLFNQ